MNRYKQIARNLILPAFVAVALAASGCGGKDEKAEPDENPVAAAVTRAARVQTVVVRPAPFDDGVELSGTVEATQDATLSAQSAGTVVGIVERGTYVKAGQTIAQLDAGIAQAGVGAAEAQVAAAQSNYDLQLDNMKRMEPLFRDSVISAIEFERTRAAYNGARAQLNQAQAGLAQAREGLGNTAVRAPFPGMVEDRLVERGEQVMPGRELVRLVNTGRVKVTASVPERYAGSVRMGTPVQADFSGSGAGLRTGHVTFVSSAINPQTRTFQVEIALDNATGQLKPAMVGRIFASVNKVESALMVPSAAVLTDDKGSYVFVAVRNGTAATAQRRQVVLGAARGGSVVVATGLRPGEEVIVSGQARLKQGDPLEVAERTAAPGVATVAAR